MSQAGPEPSLSSTRPDTTTSVVRELDASQTATSTQPEPVAGTTAPAATSEASAQQARLPPLASLTASPDQRPPPHPAFQSLLSAAASRSSGIQTQPSPQTVADNSAVSGDAAKAPRPQQFPTDSRRSDQDQPPANALPQARYQQPGEAQGVRGQHVEAHKQSPALRPGSSEPGGSSYVTAVGAYASSQSYSSRLPQPTSTVVSSAPPQYQGQPPPPRYTPMPPPVAATTQSPAFETPFRFPQGSEMQQSRPRSPRFPPSSVPRETAPHSASPERQTGGRYRSESSPSGYSYGETQGMSFQIDVQGASRVADEKRRRNAGASARFRARRKEKEQQNSREIDDLKRKIRELEEDSEYYRLERDYFVTILYNGPDRDRHFPRAPSPRRLRIRHGTEEAYASYEEQGHRGGDDRSTRRRLTGEYQPSLHEPPNSGRQEVPRQPHQQYAPPVQYAPPPPPVPPSQIHYASPPLGNQQQYYYASSQSHPGYSSGPPYGPPPPQSRPPPPPPPPSSSGQTNTSQHHPSSHHTPTHSASGLAQWPPNQPSTRPP